ncbi:MAG: dihydroorotase [Hyphomicrobium sp.]|nr:MAG: dihydroorotase [Hyphomicrobium sp.]PPD01434.1 MAG: dihydroorotase [Hyphomicrobium sp.]
MEQAFDLLISGGVVVNHEGEGVRDIGIKSGRIAAIGALGSTRSKQSIDAKGLHILPGFIDTQVHFREPGLDHKEDLETGSRAAVAGGVTAVFEMPNTKPLTTTAETLADKVRRARKRMFCDFAFFVGGTRDNVSDIPTLERLEASAGIKVFMGSSTGDLLVDDEATLDRILSSISRRASFHAEDEARLKSRMGLRRAGDPSSHPEWRDPEAALIATRRLVGLAERHKKRVHVLHVSTAEEMAFLSDHKDYASVEVTPHHLTLEAPECYERLGTYAQMNPPVRDARHKAAIWAALSSGIVDVLGSDHAPHLRSEKDHEYPDTHSGMTGVQTLLPIMLDHVNAGRLSLQRLVDLTSHGPQRLFGVIGKGRIAVGYDADLSIVDLKRRVTITNDWIESRCGWTPYDGVSVMGWPVGTIVRGHRVMWDGEIFDGACGEPVRFLEASAR